MITKYALTLDEAKAAVAAATKLAAENGWIVAIVIFDDGGHIQLLERIDGTAAGSVLAAQEKGRTALLYKLPTKVFQDAVQGGRTAILSLPGGTVLEGGLPLSYRGQVIGSVGVSGAASHEDSAVAQAVVDWVAALP